MIRRSYSRASWGCAYFHLVRARLEVAHELSQQLLGLAARLHDDELTMEARYTIRRSPFIGWGNRWLLSVTSSKPW